MKYQKEMELFVLSKVDETGKVAVNKLAKLIPKGKEPVLVFFFSLYEKGNFYRNLEISNESFVYFYELNETGKRRLANLKMEKNTESNKSDYNRKALILAIVAGIAAAIAAWPLLYHWFSKL